MNSSGDLMSRSLCFLPSQVDMTTVPQFSCWLKEFRVTDMIFCRFMSSMIFPRNQPRISNIPSDDTEYSEVANNAILQTVSAAHTTQAISTNKNINIWENATCDFHGYSSMKRDFHGCSSMKAAIKINVANSHGANTNQWDFVWKMIFLLSEPGKLCSFSCCIGFCLSPWLLTGG